MKPNLLFIGLLFIAIISLTACSKSSTTPKPATTGSFSFQGTTYTGNCLSATASGNVNVQIASTNGDFIIYNMPKQSSGTFPFTDGYTNITSTQLYGFVTISPDYATSAGGSVTKTSANTFTFTCQVYYILDDPTVYYTVSGSGTY